MKIKTGDKVKVLSGKDRGKTGKVIQVIFHDKKQEYYVVVEAVNKLKRHIRPTKRSEKGQTIELAAPMPMSKVALIDAKSGKPTRVGYKIEGGEKKRVAKISGEIII